MSKKTLSLDLLLISLSLAQDSLAEFVRQAWHILQPSHPLHWNWHLSVICEYLEAVAAGTITRLIINQPPRTAKSIVVSTLFPAWLWTKEPGARMLFASYNASLAEKFSLDRRAVITSDWYRRRWPILLAEDQNQKSEFMNSFRGHMIATSVGGGSTGKGGGLIIVDDPQTPEMAESEAERRRVNRYFDESVTPRLDDKSSGRIIVLQQRTHLDDLTGHLLDQGGWAQLCLPSQFERDTIISLPRSGRQILKREGDLLWPRGLGLEELAAQKVRLGAFGYSAQYLQNPVAREGNLFKHAWFGTFQQIPKFDKLVLSVDCAFKTGQTHDYSACTVIGSVTKKAGGAAPGFYLVDAWRGRVEFAELKRRVLAIYEDWEPDEVLIEDAASGQSLLQEFRTTNLPIRGVKPDGDKIARATSVTPQMENGRFRILEGAAWSRDYLAEMTAFPGSAHDDYVDATVQALNRLREAREPGILEYYRKKAENPGVPDSQLFGGKDLGEVYEQTRMRLEAGICHICKDSLYDQRKVESGHLKFCIPCAKKSGYSFYGME